MGERSVAGKLDAEDARVGLRLRVARTGFECLPRDVPDGTHSGRSKGWLRARRCVPGGASLKSLMDDTDAALAPSGELNMNRSGGGVPAWSAKDTSGSSGSGVVDRTELTTRADCVGLMPALRKLAYVGRTAGGVGDVAAS